MRCSLNNFLIFFIAYFLHKQTQVSQIYINCLKPIYRILPPWVKDGMFQQGIYSLWNYFNSLETPILWHFLKHIDFILNSLHSKYSKAPITTFSCFITRSFKASLSKFIRYLNSSAEVKLGWVYWRLNLSENLRLPFRSPQGLWIRNFLKLSGEASQSFFSASQFLLIISFFPLTRIFPKRRVIHRNKIW